MMIQQNNLRTECKTMIFKSKEKNLKTTQTRSKENRTSIVMEKQLFIGLATERNSSHMELLSIVRAMVYKYSPNDK